MNIYEISGRHVDITDAMRSHILEKLERLEPISSEVVDAKVVVSHSSGVADAPNKVEVQLNLPHSIIRAEERSRDAYQAMDTVVDKLERQLKRYHGRRQGKRRKTTELPIPEQDDDQEVILSPGITRIKRYVLRPMSAEDAVFQMELSGHPFYVFRNATTDEVNVAYLRHDGTYGVIQAA